LNNLEVLMKSDFLLAITQLSAEKNLPKEVVITAVEAALVSAFRKDNFATNQNISVEINPNNGRVKVWAEKTVVELPVDSRREISLAEARQIKPEAQIGETIVAEATPRNAGRIAAQTAKQVILQRLHEAEHSAVFEEYVGKEGDIVTGLVQRIEPRQIFIDLGRTEAVLPLAEQVRNERYRVGQRLKVYLLEVARTSKGTWVVVSRSHPNLLRRLFELEVPEVFNGIVELKSIAREAGYRSKVAVAARQDGIDPVGCCVGLRGIRIQNIINELNGEKIDVVMWHPDASVFIANALSPAQILSVTLNDGEGVASVVVPDQQLSLAIGKEGQNARLAAKLTGWRIDIKSASVVEVEKGAKHLAETKEEAEVDVLAETPTDLVSAEAVADSGVPFEPQLTEDKPQLRFAEDIWISGATKPGTKSKKKKKGAKESTEDSIRLKKKRRRLEIDEEEY
ncbi:transcription termination factor NusA, partial [Dehalococcoidales bacterium]|nr:transcription termination factor NusA [Dehalococcoidales bacterium]